MIVISSHIDRVTQEYNLTLDRGVHGGLLDNQIGVLLSYLAIYDDSNLLRLEQAGKIKVWHSRGEEWGMLYDPPKQIGKEDLVIVVDVSSGKRYNGYDFHVTNISGVPDKKIKEIAENMEWEGFKVKWKKYTGAEEDEDESWSWVNLGIPVMSFEIPIEDPPECRWHTEKCKVTVEKILRCRHGLKRLIAYAL